MKVPQMPRVMREIVLEDWGGTPELMGRVMRTLQRCFVEHYVLIRTIARDTVAALEQIETALPVEVAQTPLRGSDTGAMVVNTVRDATTKLVAHHRQRIGRELARLGLPPSEGPTE